MKKLVALLLALLMTVQCVAFVSAEEAYEAVPVESAEVETEADDMVVLEEEGVVPEEETEDASSDSQEKVLYGAYTLPLDGKDVVGKLSSTIPALAYVVIVPTTGVLTLVVNPTHQMSVSILNEAMTTYYVENEIIPAGAKTYNKHLNPGIYTIVLNWVNTEPDTSYTMKATHIPLGGAISGSTILTPYELVFGAEYASGAITETSTENWIQVRVAAAGKVTFETKTYQSDFQAVLSQTGTPFEKIAPEVNLNAGTPNTPGYNLFSYYLEPGAYFLKICSAVTPIKHGVYDIRATFTGVNATDVEPNNGFGVAQPLTIGKTMRGVLSETDKADVFSVMVDKATEVTVQISDYTEGLSVSMTSWLNVGVNLVTELTNPSSPGNETSPDVRQKDVRLEPNVMYYITVDKPAKTGFYDLVLQKKATVETVTVTPDGGPLGITLNMSGTASAPGALYAFEIMWYDPGLNVWTTKDKIFTGVLSAQYKPNVKGKYFIRLWMYDGFHWTYADSKQFEMADATAVTNVIFPTTPVNVRTTVPVTIKTANAKPQMYALRVVDMSTMTFVGDPIYSTTETVNFVPTRPGKFVFVGMAYDGVNWAYGYSFELEVVSALQLISLTANKTTASNREPIRYTLTTNGEPMPMVCYIYSMGDTELYRQYKSGKSMYTNDYICAFTGILDVKVHAYDGAKWHEIIGPKVTVTSDMVSVSGLTRSPVDAYVNQPITFTIDGNGIPEKTTYSLFNSLGQVVASSAARSKTYTVKVTQPGSYLCRLTYTINGVTSTVENGWFTVSNLGKVTQLIVSPKPSSVNVPVTYNAVITGVVPKTMHVYTYKSGDYTPVNVQTVVAGHPVVFTPTVAGPYSVVIFFDYGHGVDMAHPNAFYDVYTVNP